MSTGSHISGHLAFLKKILRSVDLDFDQDIHFLSVPSDLQSVMISDPQISMYRKVILFGIRPTQIGIHANDSPPCGLFQFEGFDCLTAPTLDEIESTPEYKKQLWDGLKQIFEIQKV